MGAVSIISLSIVKKQVFSSKVLTMAASNHRSINSSHWYYHCMQVHPIFVLSVADLLLSFLWIIGGGAFLRRLGNRVWCYAISLPTIVSHYIKSWLNQ